MNVKDIIHKTHLEQSEMQYVVEQYIKERKGKEGKIYCTSSIDLMKLDGAYNVAVKWFMQNEC